MGAPRGWEVGVARVFVSHASRDRTVQLWDVSDLGEPIATLDHDDSVTAVMFSPERPVLASASSDGKVHLWDVSDPAAPTLSGAPLAGHAGSVDTVAFGAGGILATGGADGTAQLWDVTDMANPQRLGPGLPLQYPVLNVVSLNSDGLLATMNGDTSVVVWDLAGYLTMAEQPGAGGLPRGRWCFDEDHWRVYVPEQYAHQDACAGAESAP